MGSIFYTAMGNPKENNGAIYRVDLDGQNHQIIVPHGATHTPKQLQVVSEHGKLYWCDREGMQLLRCSLDGSNKETLVTTGSTEQDRTDPRNWCVGVAVDHQRGKVYWTQKGPSKGWQGRLFCANIDIPKGESSSNRTDIQLLLDKLPEPIDLDIDIGENTLYLTDRGDPPFGNSISKIHLGSEGVLEKTILIRKLHEAIGLALDLKHRIMYFADLNGSLYRANMDGSDEVVLCHEIGDLTGVACVTN
jgi:DNA-binding beta-propeller fold protein YncE